MNQSVTKALGLLNLFIDHEELSLQEITEKSKMPKSTVYRLLTTLENGGMLYKTKESTHDSRYSLGLKLLELGELVSNRLECRVIALPFMEQLAEEINEAIHLVVRSQGKAAYIEKVDSTRALRLNTRVGKTTPLFTGSGPKMLLAFLPEERQDKILNSPNIHEVATKKPINIEELKQELLEIRKNKYAYSEGEQDDDTTGVSFPIFDFQGNVIASLAVSGPSSRFEGERLEMIKEKSRLAADKISIQLGYKGNN